MENQNDQVLVTRKTFLTGGQKAGYLFAGLLIGLGIRIALSVIGYIAMLPLLALPY